MIRLYLLMAAAVVAHAFAPTSFTTRTSTAASIGGTFLEDKGSRPTSSTNDDVGDPRSNFQQWVQKLEVDHRRGTKGGNLLVSGNRLIDQFMDQKSGEDSDTFSDPEILFMLMEEQYTFSFDKIYICSYDMDDAKKRLISRKARYTGLLDKLQFIQSDFEWDDEHPEIFSIPTAEQLKKYDITNWVYLQDTDHVYLCERAFEVAKECRDSLNNVVMTFMDYYADESVTIPLLDRTWNTLGADRHSKYLQPELDESERYNPDDVQYTMLVCATPTNEPEGGSSWMYDDLLQSSAEDMRLAEEGGYLFLEEDRLKTLGYNGAIITEGLDRISQHQMFRFTADALDLACFSGRALHFRDAWDPLIKRLQKPVKECITGMREGGFTSTEIMAHIFDYYVDYQYRWAVKKWQTSTGGGRVGSGKMRKNWWTAPSFQQSPQDREAIRLGQEPITKKIEEDRKKAARLTPEEKEIQSIATEWAKREFYKASTSGTLDDTMTEEKFVESVWDEAVTIAEERYIEQQRYVPEDEDMDEKTAKYQAVLAQKAESEIASLMGVDDISGGDKKDDDDDEDE
mmetsp:Transcript_7225/g.10569  ORF Transcript_7225/g.10569 Transcript_7225/m.10569 type:complete len:569 (-) Transcript_7225:137-1843(-)|eukprot:CAMPEP_0194204172 /NCGR_PEP_ID=MMETSP0156-20130528/3774_1 /TAXON_ID=33649 /ORGANISM="Thalassionema nitzschioides, Strain L26-B" /LENGTH=568 /DNA_ID=CAMNT_0038930123 /DNA_START=95 /DNA_END=1801 /DNA_ORIENTATION=-